jgi:hypothetical protein
MNDLTITVTANLPQESIEHIIAEVTKRVTAQSADAAVAKKSEALVAEPGKMYTVAETAKILRVSQSSIAKYSRQGLLESCKPGGKRMFKGSVILKYLENGTA